MITRYATPNGSRFHSDAMCLGLNSWYTKHGTDRPPTVTLAQLRARNLEPCTMCRPTGFGLTVVR